MPLFPFDSPAIAASGVWIPAFDSYAGFKPFNQLKLENFSYSPVDLYINNRWYCTVQPIDHCDITGLQNMELDEIRVVNKIAFAIPEKGLRLTLSNGDLVLDSSGVSSIQAKDIDVLITVTETQQALSTLAADYRFAPYFELYVQSMGTLTAGTHKIYHGSAMAKELINWGSYYNYEQIRGKNYDLSTIYVKCDNPYAAVNMINNYDFETNTDGWTPWFQGNGTSGQSAVWAGHGTKSMFCQKLDTTGSGYLWTALNNTPGEGATLYGDLMINCGVANKKLNVQLFSTVGGVNTYELNSWYDLQAGPNTLTFVGPTPAPAGTITGSQMWLGFEGMAHGEYFNIDYLHVYRTLGTYQRPKVVLSGGY